MHQVQQYLLNFLSDHATESPVFLPLELDVGNCSITFQGAVVTFFFSASSVRNVVGRGE